MKVHVQQIQTGNLYSWTWRFKQTFSLCHWWTTARWFSFAFRAPMLSTLCWSWSAFWFVKWCHSIVILCKFQVYIWDLVDDAMWVMHAINKRLACRTTMQRLERRTVQLALFAFSSLTVTSDCHSPHASYFRAHVLLLRALRRLHWTLTVCLWLGV